MDKWVRLQGKLINLAHVKEVEHAMDGNLVLERCDGDSVVLQYDSEEVARAILDKLSAWTIAHEIDR